MTGVQTCALPISFSAQINRAKMFESSASKREEMKKELKKMLADEKNTEYFDQIYYSLANIAQKEGDLKATIEYLMLSASSSISNNRQKGLSFLKLADIYFDKPNYRLAMPYYDSAATFLTDNYTDYDKIVNKKNSLTDIVKYLSIIAYEDSVQNLAGMSKKERNAVVDKIIKKIREEEERKREEQETRDRKSTRLNSSHIPSSRMPSSA